MNENIAITFAGGLISIISAWRYIKSKESFIYNVTIFSLGVFFIVASIHKENKDSNKEQLAFTNDSLKTVKIDALLVQFGKLFKSYNSENTERRLFEANLLQKFNIIRNPNTNQAFKLPEKAGDNKIFLLDLRPVGTKGNTFYFGNPEKKDVYSFFGTIYFSRPIDSVNLSSNGRNVLDPMNFYQSMSNDKKSFSFGAIKLDGKSKIIVHISKLDTVGLAFNFKGIQLLPIINYAVNLRTHIVQNTP